MVIIIQVIQTAHIMSESDPLGNHLRYVHNITTVTHEIIKSREIQKCGKLVVYDPRVVHADVTFFTITSLAQKRHHFHEYDYG